MTNQGLVVLWVQGCALLSGTQEGGWWWGGGGGVVGWGGAVQTISLHCRPGSRDTV